MKKLKAFVKHEVFAVRHTAYQMEFNAETQWRYHRRMCWFWVANFLPITGLLYAVLSSSTREAVLFTAIMLGVNTYYSLYANFCTDYDAVSASFAAMKAQEAAERLKMPAVPEVTDITPAAAKKPAKKPTKTPAKSVPLRKGKEATL